MSPWIEIALGVLLGAAGALLNLVVARWRAAAIVLRRRAGVLALPLGLGLVAGAILAAAALSPRAAWAAAGTLLVARHLLLRHAANANATTGTKEAAP